MKIFNLKKVYIKPSRAIEGFYPESKTISLLYSFDYAMKEKVVPDCMVHIVFSLSTGRSEVVAVNQHKEIKETIGKRTYDYFTQSLEQKILQSDEVKKELLSFVK